MKNIKLKYTYYICKCGRKIIPVTNPSKCPHCGRITRLKWEVDNMGKNQHVTPHPYGGWQVKGAGNSKATVRTTTQREAIGIARAISKNQNSELIIHRTNGQIREKDSHGKDPFPPKG